MWENTILHALLEKYKPEICFRGILKYLSNMFLFISFIKATCLLVIYSKNSCSSVQIYEVCPSKLFYTKDKSQQSKYPAMLQKVIITIFISRLERL